MALADVLKTGSASEKADASFRLSLKRYRGFEALERLVGRDWEGRLRAARADDEWRQDWEMRDYYRDEWRNERWGGLKPTLRERAKCEDNYALNRLQRWAYTAKAVACILLDLHFRPKPAQALRFHYIDTDDGLENTVTAYRDGFDKRTAKRIKVHRHAITNSWKPMTREKALGEARDRLRWEDGWRDVDFINTGTISSHSDGYGWSASWMSVPHGWLRWGYRVQSDGDSSY